MNAGHAIVIVAGLVWIGSACLLAEVARLLGPKFNTTRTVHWGWRRLAELGALVFLLRGLTLMYPGQLVEVSRISVMAPVAAVTVLGVVAALLHWVQSDRSPPPWSVRFLELVALLGRDQSVIRAAMIVPPAAIGDIPPIEEPMDRRRFRLTILIGCALVMAAIAAFLALNSPVA